MYEIYHNLTIKADPSIIFHAITNPGFLDQWWTQKSKGSPDLGVTYTFWFGPDYDWRAEVIEVTENKSIVFKMCKADDDWINTLLSFTLESEKDGGIRLHFTHSHWKKRNTHFGQSNFCWAEYLSGLKRLVEEDMDASNNE